MGVKTNRAERGGGMKDKFDPTSLKVIKVCRGTKEADMLLKFVEDFSWEEVKAHMIGMLRDWRFTDWETPFAALTGGRIAGMAAILKTDYYPLPDVFPWVTCIFVSEAYRGRRISGEMIGCANRYLRQLGFDRSYIPTEYIGLYERYGYRFVRDIVNYGGGTDRLYVKELGDGEAPAPEKNG